MTTDEAKRKRKVVWIHNRKVILAILFVCFTDQILLITAARNRIPGISIRPRWASLIITAPLMSCRRRSSTDKSISLSRPRCRNINGPKWFQSHRRRSQWTRFDFSVNRPSPLNVQITRLPLMNSIWTKSNTSAGSHIRPCSRKTSKTRISEPPFKSILGIYLCWEMFMFMSSCIYVTYTFATRRPFEALETFPRLIVAQSWFSIAWNILRN